MKIKKIDHLGIIVPKLEEGIYLFREGLKLSFIKEEELPEWNCKIAFFQCGEVLIELVEPTGPSDGIKFLEERGGGLHHIAFEVEDIEKAFTDAKPIFVTKTDSITSGAGESKVFFLEEKTILNMPTEFVELKRRD